MTDTITITATVPADMAADVWQRIGAVVEAAGLDPGLVVCSFDNEEARMAASIVDLAVVWHVASSRRLAASMETRIRAVVQAYIDRGEND